MGDEIAVVITNPVLADQEDYFKDRLTRMIEVEMIEV